MFNYRFEIDNTLSTNLTVKYESRRDGAKTLKINPNESSVIYYGEGFKCGCPNCKGFRINSVDSSINYFILNLWIYKNDTVKTTIDYNKENNWSFESKNKLGIYTAKIKDSDF
jgi:hypothetical protein